MSGGSKKQTVGYKYYLGMHLALCHGPVDRLVKLQVDDKCAWVGRAIPGETVTVSAEGLFGGESREGGVSGSIDFEGGGPAQVANSYLVSKLGSLVPAFRGVACLVLNGMYLGMNPYLKPWAAWVQRIHTRGSDGAAQWYDAKAEIGSLVGGRQAIYIAVDTSTSMDVVTSNGQTRLANAKTAINGFLDYLDTQIAAGLADVDISVVGWDATAVASTVYGVTSAGIATLKSFVSGLTTAGGTDFRVAVEGVADFYAAAGPCAARTVLFLTDGEPSVTGAPGEEAVIAAEAAAILFATGGIASYGINIDLSDTTYTAYMDNTADDGVPVVSGADPDALTDTLTDSLVGQLDMNPAHIVRECLTDLDWGMGYGDADIDSTSFEAAADALYAEEFGLSLLWDRQVPIEDFVREVLRHIDATLYVDPATGKFVLKLIRDDYTLGSLLTLDASTVDRIEGWTRPAFDELVNVVTVRYWDASTGTDASVTVHDNAAVQQQGQVIAQTLTYAGITSASLATRVGERDLRALSLPLASCTLYTHRDHIGSLAPGGAFKLTWPDYEVTEVVLRVTGLAYNANDGGVRLTVTEDVFALPTNPVLAQPDTEWEEPSSAPTAATVRIAVEAPYWELVQRLGEAAAEDRLASNPDAGYLLATAGRPTSDAINAVMQVDAGAGYAEAALVDFCPIAELDGAISETDTASIPITGGVDLDLATLGSFAQIDDELVEVTALSATAMTIARGVLDTVPAAHVTGSKIIFWDAFAGNDPTEYATSEVLDVKLQPVTGLGTLPLASATADEVTMAQRAERPYPPGKVRINGDAYPAEVTGMMTVTWAHRDRLQQTAVLVDESEASIGPEAGTTYTVEVYGDDDLLAHTETGITGTSWLEDAGDGVGNGDLTVELWSVRGGLESWQHAVVAVNRPPPTIPTSVTATADGGLSSITVTWVDESSDELNFDLQYDTDVGFGSPTTVQPVADSESYKVTGLTRGLTYYFRIRAVHPAPEGAGDWSATASATVWQLSDVTLYADFDANAGVYQDSGTTPVASDGDPVGQVQDQSGNGYHISNVSTKPVWKTNQLNSLPVIRHAATDILQAALASDWKFLHDGTQWAAVMVWKTASANPDAFMALFDTGGLSQFDIGCALSYEDRASLSADDQMAFQTAKGSSGRPINIATTNESAAGGAWHIAAPRMLSAAGEITNDSAFGGYATAAQGATPSASNPTSALTVGGRYNNTFNLDGDWARLMFISGAVGDADYQALQDYASETYGLARTAWFGSADVVQHDASGKDFNGMPGLGITASGRLILGYTKRTSHTSNDGDLTLRTSDDGGVTLGSETTLWDHTTDGSGDIWYTTPRFTKLTDGTLLMAVGKHDAGDVMVDGIGLFKTTDEGDSWTGPTDLTEAIFTAFSTEGGGILELANGDLLYPYYGRDTGDAANRMSCAVLKSTDVGVTWTALATVADGPADGKNWTEPGLVQISNGNVLCLVREDVGKDAYLFTSTDMGVTWSAGTLVADCYGMMTPLRLSTGEIIAPQRSHISGDNLRARILFTGDEGTTWQLGQLFAESPNFTDLEMVYGQFQEGPAGQIYLAYAQEDTGQTVADVMLAKTSY